ncbi:uncharacterized protein LOC129749348 [Uranotaenia lowii]|uniref:uncharacterized protein LOC129749348 n=1 Tax=Uranotaenia lowii TaxID=190385 RepID=UPI00247AA079|nr:uncharacterized protein LOC129749348 [Uranotaenia lowii]
METNKDEAQRCIDLAKENLKLAENLAEKSYKIYPTLENEDFLRRINRISTSSPESDKRTRGKDHEESKFNGDYAQVNESKTRQFNVLRKDNFNEDNLGNANELAKTNRKYDKKSKVTLSQQETTTTTNKNNYNQPKVNVDYTQANENEALRCIDLAESAFSEGNLEKAIKLIDKSIKMCPLQKATDVLRRLKNASLNAKKRATRVSEEYYTKLKANVDFTQANKDEALRYIELAEAALNEGHLKKAIQFTEKSIYLCPLKEAQTVLRDLKTASMKAKRQATSKYYNKPKVTDDYNQTYKNQALRCIELAKAAFNEGNLEKAKNLAEKSVKLHRLEEADDFLQRLKSASTPSGTNTRKQTTSANKKNYDEPYIKVDYSRINKEEALRCIDLAKAAFNEGNLEKANFFAEKSIKLCQLKAAEELLQRIESTSSSSSRPSDSNAQRQRTSASEENYNKPKVNVDYNQINKEEALRCINLAKAALNEGNLEKAKKLAEKSIKLCPLREAEALLRRVESAWSSSSSCPKENTARKRATSAKKETEREPKLNVDYTQAQLDAVQKVLKGKDCYEILGITKEASGFEIEKTYKKLALLLHPDKNKAPGSVQAFQFLLQAVAEARKCKVYNMSGGNSGHRFSSTGNSHGNKYESDTGYRTTNERPENQESKHNFQSLVLIFILAVGVFYLLFQILKGVLQILMLVLPILCAIKIILKNIDF